MDLEQTIRDLRTRIDRMRTQLNYPRTTAANNDTTTSADDLKAATNIANYELQKNTSQSHTTTEKH